MHYLIQPDVIENGIFFGLETEKSPKGLALIWLRQGSQDLLRLGPHLGWLPFQVSVVPRGGPWWPVAASGSTAALPFVFLAEGSRSTSKILLFSLI